MRKFPRPVSVVVRLGFAVVWMAGLLGPLPAVPVAASAPARPPVSPAASPAASPVPDDFADADVITLPPAYSIMADMSTATSQADEPFACGSYDIPSIWYQFTPTQTGFYNFSAEGSNVDHSINIYTGDALDDLFYVDCDSEYFPDSVDLSVLLSAEHTYYIQLTIEPQVQQGAQGGPIVALTVTALAGIAGTVWDDANGDGIQDAGEPGLPGASVTLLDEFDYPLAFVTTDANGGYQFPSAPIDEILSLVFAPPPPGVLAGSPQDATTDDVDSDADPYTGQTAPFTLSTLETADFDAGFGALAEISGRAWRDLNSNNGQDPGEPGLQNVSVCLQTDSDFPYDCSEFTYTAADGSYSFRVLPGNYSLVFGDYLGYTRAALDQGGNVGSADDVDSDADVAEGRVAAFTAALGDVLDFDAGYQTTGFGDRVWRDFAINGPHNGLQDAGEPGVQGVEIELYTSADVYVQNTYTDVNGDYAFIDLTPGDYYAVFLLPPANDYTTQDAGSDDALDSDVDPNTGKSPIISLTAGQLDLSVDAGFTKDAFIVDNLSEFGDDNWGDGFCVDTGSVVDAPYGLCSLRAAIEEANANPDYDLVLFDATVFSVSLTIPQTFEYFINYGVWIEGPGGGPLTLDAGSNSRHFYIDYEYDADVRLSDMRLLNGYAGSGDGGSIYNWSRLTLENLIIEASSADYTGGGLRNDHYALLNSVTITDSSASDGGAIFNTDVLIASNSYFQNNRADEGGAVVNGHLMRLTSTIIDGNAANYGDGGGILNFGALTASDLTVTNNFAYGDGGGLASQLGGDLSANCLAANVAGCRLEYTPAVTLTAGSHIANNVAGVADDEPRWGGGLYNGFGPLLINGSSEVVENTVYGYGGGVYNEGNSGFNVADLPGFCFNCPASVRLLDNSVLAFNTAHSIIIDENSPYTIIRPGRGGGLYNLGLATIDGSSIHDNTANAGAGFYNASFDACFCPLAFSAPYEATLFVQNQSSVTENVAVQDPNADPNYGLLDELLGLGGGGVNAGHAEVLNSSVSNNTAAWFGGGLFNGFTDGFFTSAEQAAPAGIPSLLLPTLLIQDSVVANNDADPVDDGSAQGLGGGVFNLFGAVEVDHSTLAGNTAGEWGGGVLNGCLFCLFGPGSTVANSPQGPLVSLILFSKLYVHNDSVITDNSANPNTYSNGFFGSAGGGVFNSGLAVIDDSAVVSNTAYADYPGDGAGGGIANIAFLTMHNTHVDHNRSDGDGGGIVNSFFFGISQAADLAPAGPLGPISLFDLPPGLSLDEPLAIYAGSSVSDNRANPDNQDTGYGWGGGLFSLSPAVINDSLLDNNWAQGNGGGIALGNIGFLAQSGVAAVAPSCLQGFIGTPNDTVSISNTTLSHNHAGRVEVEDDPQAVGGGVYISGSISCGGKDLNFEAANSLLIGNTATAGGGGLYVDGGEATLHNTDLIDNDADSDDDGYGNGGGSYNDNGYLLIDPANVIGNFATYGAGGFYVAGYTLITQTTFATNTAAIAGGGIAISGTADVEVANSTFSANLSGSGGAGIFQRDDDTILTLLNVTIANNNGGIAVQAGPAGLLGDGSGLYRADAGITDIFNTIIYGNGALTSDCSFTNPVTNVGGLANLGDSTCSFIPGWTTANPLLGPLQYNGGQNGVLTHALLAASPAIGAADPSVCAGDPVNGVDERDVLRLLDFACDIGAFEFETLTAIELVSFTASAQGQTVTLAWKTAVEVDTAGFNLYRAASAGGPYVKVNALLIGAQGPQGGSYSAQDAPGVGVWYYKLEDVDTHGAGTFHGPVAVTVGSGTTANNVIYLPLISH